MATYRYRCVTDGEFDLARPIGTAPARAGCPACGTPSRRRWTPPLLSTADPRRMALIEATSATAERPAVVTTPPPRPTPRGRTVSLQDNPALARLPRP
jgi:hypothetical protein